MCLPIEVVWEIAEKCDVSTLKEFRMANRALNHIGTRSIQKVMTNTLDEFKIECKRFNLITIVQKELLYLILILIVQRLQSGKTLTIVIQSSKTIRFPNKYSHYNTYDTVYISCYTNLYAIETALLTTTIKGRKIVKTNSPDDFFSTLSGQPFDIEMMVIEDTCGEDSKLLSLHFHF